MNECWEFLRMSEMEQIVIVATDGFCNWSVTQLLDRPLPQQYPQGSSLSKGEDKRLACDNRHLRST